MRLQAQDNPLAILTGPVAAILILLKHRTNIYRMLCGRFSGFSSNSAITHNILNLLFDCEEENTMLRLISHIHNYNHEDAHLLRAAFGTCESLSPHNRIRTIVYINSILQFDVETIALLQPFITDSPQLANIMSWYRKQSQLRCTTPVGYPSTKRELKILGMYTNSADWENYQENYLNRGLPNNPTPPYTVYTEAPSILTFTYQTSGTTETNSTTSTTRSGCVIN